jgi:hypothetical protein
LSSQKLVFAPVAEDLADGAAAAAFLAAGS